MTSPPTVSPFDIPHIADAILEQCSFKDLYSCLFVHRTWHDAVIPLLWKELIDFRLVQQPNGTTTYHHYFLTPTDRQGLIKYAHHIRTLTCHGDSTLPGHVHGGVSNLIAINYNIGYAPEYRAAASSSPHDFGPLLALARMNQMLHAVSVENISLSMKFESLQSFIQSLGSSITNLYFGGAQDPDITKLYRRKARAKYPTPVWPLGDLMNRCLDRVNSSKVTKLKLKRGIHRGSRRLTVLEIEDKTNVWPGTLWEDDGHGQYDYCDSWFSLAVFECNGTLLVYMPSRFPIDALSILRRYSALKGVHFSFHCKLGPRFLQELLAACPHIHDIDFPLSADQASDVVSFFSDPNFHMSSVGLLFHQESVDIDIYTMALRPFLIQPARHYLCEALVKTDFSIQSILMSSVFEILSVCSSLDTFKALDVVIDGSEPHVCPLWATRKLQVLSFHLFRNGGRESAFSPHVISEQDFALSSESAFRLAPAFMVQMGQQKQLRKLSLTFDLSGQSPFLALTLDEPHGLQQLSELSRLEDVYIEGLENHVQEAEKEWMAQHWPQLESFRVHEPRTNT
ncbi:hypothetical protein BGZ82_007768 [Podila clonocystis]|nr:hypothetical protein BGZ82_007768 [Podila clonocystis]